MPKFVINPRLGFIFYVFSFRLNNVIRREIEKLILNVVKKKLGVIKPPDFSVEKSENEIHGDYSSNIAFILTKVLKRKPSDLAIEIAGKLAQEKIFEKVETAGGFINFSLDNSFLVSLLQKKLKNKKIFGKNIEGRGKTVLVEYFQLNIAKRPHVGHLRSAVIGDALKRMFLLSGYKAVSDTHVGDWGTQFGILLLGFKETRMNIKDKKILTDPFGVLEELYKKENAKIEVAPERLEKAKLEFAKLERGDAKNRKIWKWMVDISMKNLKESALMLNLEKFDEHRGESSYEKDMPAIVVLALKKGVARKQDGAVIVDLSQEGLDEAILIKSDGASTYLLRDLATILYRKKRWKFWKNLYVVDARQKHHFKQVFSVAEKLGFEGVGQSEHIEFGAMTLPEGKISTRKGNTISLTRLMDEAKGRALAVIREKNPKLRNIEKIAEEVGLGAIKYFDLARNRKSDITFRWDRALEFEGDSGPYIQYTHARLKSILRKAKKIPVSPKKISEPDHLEHEIISRVLAFEEAVLDSLSLYMPNILAGYLHGLAQKTNEFYHTHPVLNEPDNDKRALRLWMVNVATITLKQGLWCLGIEAPEEM